MCQSSAAITMPPEEASAFPLTAARPVMDSWRRSARLAAFSRCSHCPRASAASALLHSPLPSLGAEHDARHQ